MEEDVVNYEHNPFAQQEQEAAREYARWETEASPLEKFVYRLLWRIDSFIDSIIIR